MTFLFPSCAFVQIVLLCIITNWSWPHPANTEISVARFSLKWKHAFYCDMHYICYSLSTTKIDSRNTFTNNKAIVIRQKNEKDDTRCLFHFPCSVWSSNEHQRMVQNLFVVLVYCDFAVILVHQMLCKEKKNRIAMLFNSWNKFLFYPKWGIVHIRRQNPTGKRVEKVSVHSIIRIS